MQKTIKPCITKCEKSCNLNNFNISVDILPQITAKFPQKHSLNINRADSLRRGQYQLRLSVGCVVVEIMIGLSHCDAASDSVGFDYVDALWQWNFSASVGNAFSHFASIGRINGIADAVTLNHSCALYSESPYV